MKGLPGGGVGAGGVPTEPSAYRAGPKLKGQPPVPMYRRSTVKPRSWPAMWLALRSVRRQEPIDDQRALEFTACIFQTVDLRPISSQRLLNLPLDLRSKLLHTVTSGGQSFDAFGDRRLRLRIPLTG